MQALLWACVLAALSRADAGCKITVTSFGSYVDDGGVTQDVTRYTLTNTHGMTISVIDYGATLVNVLIPDGTGRLVDIVMGFDNMEGYRSEKNPYFGATVGRVGNRIKNGQFYIGDVLYNISTNEGNNTLHGGLRGFDKVMWHSILDLNKVVMTYNSPDGEEGFPGEVNAMVTYWLTDDNVVEVEVRATSSKPTPVNIINHSYFNLAGHGAGSEKLYAHTVVINADEYTETDSESIPTGNLLTVNDTVYDLRTPRRLGDVIDLVPGGGYDNNFCITSATGEVKLIASVSFPDEGRLMEVWSNQPGVQFYTSNGLPEVGNITAMVVGKDDTPYYKHGALCLETQNYPDAINHPNFPNSILSPGEEYVHLMKYHLLW